LAQLLYILILISATLLYYHYKAAPGGVFAVYSKIRAYGVLAMHSHAGSVAAGFFIAFFLDVAAICHNFCRLAVWHEA
jgi:hypothetical protein